MKKYFFISFIFFLFLNLQSADININPNQIFVGTNIQFNFISSNTGPILNPEWDFGDSSPKANGTSTNHFYKEPGNYTVKFTWSEEGEDKEITKNIVVGDNRKVEISPSYVTVGQTVTIKLTNSTVSVVEWKLGMDVMLKNSPNTIQYKFLDPGEYKIICIIPNQTPVKSVINVKENRSIVLTQKYLFEGSKAQFKTRNFNSPNLKWNFGDSTIQHGGKNISHIFLRSGNYLVKVFDFDGKSKKPVEKRLNVLRENRRIELKYMVLYKNSEVEIQARNFKDSSIKWEFGDNSTQMGSNWIKHTYKRIGAFTIKAIDMGGKDTKAITKQVNVVNDNRRIQLPAEIIAGEPVDLQLKDAQTSNFIWEFKNGEKRHGNFVKSKNFKFPGFQTIKIVDKSGKYPDLIKKIDVKPDKRKLKSSIDYSLPNEIINFKALNFNGPGIKWVFGDGTIKENGNINEKHEYKSCGKYKVKAIDFNGRSAKIFSKDIYVSELLPDFQVNSIEIAFNNGKYYRVTSRKNMPPGYSVKIKAKGRGIVKGQWLLDGMTVGLFEVLLKENQIKIIKGRNVPKLPVIDLGIHNFTFNFTNYSFNGKIPKLKYFVAESGMLQIKNPLPGVKISGQKIIKLKWLPLKRKVSYEIAISEVPFQFLKDEQIKWINLEQKREFNLDSSKYKKNIWIYWMVRAINKNGKVVTTSEPSSFKIL